MQSLFGGALLAKMHKKQARPLPRLFSVQKPFII